MANLKVLKAFRLSGNLKTPGEIITVDNEKATYIIGQGWAEDNKPKPKPKAKAKAKDSNPKAKAKKKKK
tara:strand:+ start:634 stop:840 length:207 start_codon:yes stop_codon:yes gene_type:complete